MKGFLVLLLTFGTQLLVHSLEEPCGADNCPCDFTKYTASVKPPNPTITCDNGVMNIYISKCQLIKSKFNVSNLALTDSSTSECQSAEYLVDGEVKVGFHDPLSVKKCGNTITTNATHVIYTNILHIYPEVSKLISRNNATANVSCAYPLNYNVSLNSSSITPNLTTTILVVPGTLAAVTVTMVAYTKPDFTSLVDAQTVLYVDQTVYISVYIPNLQADTFSIKVLRIYAGGADSSIYNLTSGDGCPDPTYGDLISVVQNGDNTEARFALQVFKITDSDIVNLYADVTICPEKCVSTCSGRSGDGSTSGDVATLRLDLTADSTAYSGAIERFSMQWTLLFLISSLLFVKLI